MFHGHQHSQPVLLLLPPCFSTAQELLTWEPQMAGRKTEGLPYLQKIELLTMAQFQTHLPKLNLYQPSVTWAVTHQKLVRPRECVAVHLPLFERPDHGSVVRCSLQGIGRKNPHVPHTSCKIPMLTRLNLYPHVLSHNLPCLLLNFLKLFG